MQQLNIEWSHQLEKKAKERKKTYKHFFKRANKNKILERLPDLHSKAFSEIDCLSCANCCKHYSPRFRMPDIKRIAKTLKIKETQLITNYLRLDEDGDYVVQSLPCPFLDNNNYCTIYEDRPRDCARYPYTNEDVLYKQVNLTLKNATICPAVYYVLENLCSEV